MAHDNTVFVGLDVHKDSIAVAYAVGFGEVASLGSIGVLQRDLQRLCHRMQGKAANVEFVYEAGPCGYGLQRQLQAAGFTDVQELPVTQTYRPATRYNRDFRIGAVRAGRDGGSD